MAVPPQVYGIRPADGSAVTDNTFEINGETLDCVSWRVVDDERGHIMPLVYAPRVYTESELEWLRSKKVGPNLNTFVKGWIGYLRPGGRYRIECMGRVHRFTVADDFVEQPMPEGSAFPSRAAWARYRALRFISFGRWP